MFETVLAEIKLATAALNAGKYFTSLSHGGKAATNIGDLGVKYFEGGASISAAECTDLMLDDIQTACDELEAANAKPKASGTIDWVSMFLPVILDFLAKIRASRKG